MHAVCPKNRGVGTLTLGIGIGAFASKTTAGRKKCTEVALFWGLLGY
jgi:hypothetical protein